MQNKIKAIFFSLLIATSIMGATTHAVFAKPGDGGTDVIGGSGGGIENPLEGSASSITDVLKKVINWMLGLVGIIALIALISAGARMIFGFVDEDQVKKAKMTILWAVIGLAVVILSYAIINIVTTEILGAGSNSNSSYNDSGDVITPNNINTNGYLPSSS